MLRERAGSESLWESVLPAELRELPPELGKVDAILDDDRFLAPFRSRLTARSGPPDDSGRDLSAADVPQVPLRAWLRDALQGGRRLVHVAAFLPDRGRWAGARPVDLDEADQAARAGAFGGAERRVARACGRAEGVALAPVARRHDAA